MGIYRARPVHLGPRVFVRVWGEGEGVGIILAS